MKNFSYLLKEKSFKSLFWVQYWGAFNDQLFKNSLVWLVIFGIINDAQQETIFSALATGVFTLPFFLFSALAGQLADSYDKANIIRYTKLWELGIMLAGALMLMLVYNNILPFQASIIILLTLLFAMGTQSTFFGPIKYAILPQHLEKGDVLSGTGLIEAGTYIAILLGTVLSGLIPVWLAAVLVVFIAAIGYASSRKIPPAPPIGTPIKVDYNPFRSTYHILKSALSAPTIYRAIISISLFWTIGAVLFIQFPAITKNIFHADQATASLFLAIFSIGIAIGSVMVNHLLNGKVSARYSPLFALLMAGATFIFFLVAKNWEWSEDQMRYSVLEFIQLPGIFLIVPSLLAISIFGGAYVVPIYAFLTTNVAPNQTSKTVAANNIMNSGMMAVGAIIAYLLAKLGTSITDQLLFVMAMCFLATLTATDLAHKEKKEKRKAMEQSEEEQG